MPVCQIESPGMPGFDVEVIASRTEADPLFRRSGLLEMRQDGTGFCAEPGNDPGFDVAIESDVLDGSSRNQQAVGTLQEISGAMPDDGAAGPVGLMIADQMAFYGAGHGQGRHAFDHDRIAPGSRGNHKRLTGHGAGSGFHIDSILPNDGARYSAVFRQ